MSALQSLDLRNLVDELRAVGLEETATVLAELGAERDKLLAAVTHGPTCELQSAQTLTDSDLALAARSGVGPWLSAPTAFAAGARFAESHYGIGTAKPARSEDPCPGCKPSRVCRTPSCGRLQLPVDSTLRAAQPAQGAVE